MCIINQIGMYKSYTLTDLCQTLQSKISSWTEVALNEDVLRTYTISDSVSHVRESLLQGICSTRINFQNMMTWTYVTTRLYDLRRTKPWSIFKIPNCQHCSKCVDISFIITDIITDTEIFSEHFTNNFSNENCNKTKNQKKKSKILSR